MNPRVRRRLWSLLLAAALWVFGAGTAQAQCPDGSPPPCGSRRPTQAGAPAPRLDARQWIVVPFNNVTRAPEVEWLRDASVNLLTMEIGRWTDVQVVNDKRVGDLLQEIPADRRGQALTLNEGLQLARRAGAGMLVMGDFAKLGKGARVSANVFDVRTGARVRTAEQRLGDADSLLAVFGPLSRGVLAVPPPPDSRSGEIGTASLQAYQAYQAGVRALNRWQLDAAERELTRALALDSTFALPHLFMSMRFGWTEVGEFPEATSHALAAQRLGAGLPPRERALISAQLAIARSDYAEACRSVAPIVARDSSDVLAMYMLGDCAYHDFTVIPGAHDTLPGTVKWGRNLSLSMMRRVLMLDPSFHQAFRHILDILRTPQFTGCVKANETAPCESWRASVLRDGDSLLIQPLSPRNPAGIARQQARAASEKPFVANVLLARRIADDWLGSDSSDVHARLGLALALLSQGDAGRAEAHFRRIPASALQGDGSDMRSRMESAMKTWDAETARAWYDSLVKMIPDNQAIRATPFRGSMELMFGRAGRVHAALVTTSQRAGAPAGGGSPEALAYMRAIPRVFSGFPVPDLDRLEAAYVAAMRDTATCRADCVAVRVYPTLGLALRAPRATWPAALASATAMAYQPARALMLRDTALLRQAAQALDSSARSRVAMGWPDDAHGVIAAEAYLALGDSAAALRVYRFAVDSVIPLIPITRGFGFGIGHVAWWTRAARTRAELAAARGYTDEARLWYDRVLAFYADADPEFAADVARIRSARAALGSAASP